ncbi:MAG: sulfatase-like hydrolase/transferase [Saccharofermentans sp.]|nr:sulfatase-like hydrolase/transferase [Saccharofermentans sp.]
MRKEYKLFKPFSLTNRKRRYVFAAIMTVLLFVVLFLNIGVFSDVRVKSCSGVYNFRNGVISVEPLTQRFVPKSNVVKYLEVHFDDCHYKEGYINFRLEDATGNLLYEENVYMNTIEESDIYYRFEINQTLEKGSTYYIKIISQDMPSWYAPKVWCSNNLKDEVGEVIFRGQPANKHLQMNLEIGYGTFHYYGFAVSIAAILLTAGIILLQLHLSYKLRARICLALMLIMPLAMYIVVESLNNQSVIKKNPAAIIVNYIFYLIIYCVFMGVINHFRFAVLFSNTVIYIIAIVNFYKMEFRGEPFSFSDFASMSTAMNVASEYHIALRYMILTTGLVFLLITAVVSRFRFSIRRKRIRFTLLGVSTLFMVLIVMALFNTDRYTASKDSIMKRLGIVNNVWNQPKNYSDNGVLIAITMNAKYLKVSPPSVYSLENLESVTNDVSDNYGYNMLTDVRLIQMDIHAEPETTLPNIICIMDESYSDFSQFGDISLTKDYSPFMDSLAYSDQAIKGDLFVSTFGGGTANSEFEFLTGNSMLGMPAGSIPYQQYISGETGALPRTLKNMGYNTYAIHPYIASGWNRPVVYEGMAFDEFISEEDFINKSPVYLRAYISDKSSFDMVIDKYKENRAESDAPVFIFNVTMQNHGGYTKTYEGFSPDVFYSPNPGMYTEAEQYFSVARRTDSAVEYLIDYFSKVDEPTVICFFGDHLPSFKDGFYENLLGVNDIAQLSPEQMQKMYTTDFFIWANYPINNPTEINNISLNYLSTLLMQVAGIPLTDYQRFLTNLYMEYPIVTTLGISDRDGNYIGGPEIIMGTDLWNYYAVLEYNEVFGDKDRVSTFFDYPVYMADEIEAGTEN